MPVNSDKPSRWKADVALSVDFYNEWFLDAAPTAFREKRSFATEQVRVALSLTDNLSNIRPETIRDHPEILQMLRMTTAPPLARDRLVGLAGVRRSLVGTMEKELRTPTKNRGLVDEELTVISEMIGRLVDRDLFSWLGTARSPGEVEVSRAAMIVADRLCGVLADPIIRNAQEQRQLSLIKTWLEAKHYRIAVSNTGLTVRSMQPGTFAFRLNVPVNHAGISPRGTEVLETDLDSELLGIPVHVEDARPTREGRVLNIPIDVAVMPISATASDLPVMIEAKSAGDFTNTNKRRKEEAAKVGQLRATYGSEVQFILFRCGYFDAGYLGYEAAEGIDWVWEHRIEDLAGLGL